MAIPPFTAYGSLPEGVHDYTLEEATQQFGTFQHSDRRLQLWSRFLAFVNEAKASDLIDAILVDGSFITAEPVPNDIDIIVVVPRSMTFH